jgi:hypothetical protein
LGGAFLFILVLVLIVVVVFLGAAFGGTLGSNPGAPDAEAGQEAAQRIVPAGTISAAVGLGLSAIGAYYGAIEFSVLGIMLGAFAYYRGARYLGIAVMLLSLAAIFIGQNLGYQTSRFGF